MEKKVLLFPGLEKQLEEKAFEAIERKEYTLALAKLEALLSHQISSYRIYLGKVICLIRLRRFDEAVDYCESLLAQNDAHYYDYLEYMFMALYHSNEYKQIMVIYNEEKDKIPSTHGERFTNYNLLAQQMNEEIVGETLREFDSAYIESDYIIQWKTLNELYRLDEKIAHYFIPLLEKVETHPVIKTFIFIWLQEIGERFTVKIEKFGDMFSVSPKEFYKWEEHPVYLETKSYFDPIEQKNPTLYEQIMTLLNNYCYVIYPVMYELDEAEDVATTILHIIKSNLSLESTLDEKNEQQKRFSSNILLCHQLYEDLIH